MSLPRVHAFLLLPLLLGALCWAGGAGAQSPDSPPLGPPLSGAALDRATEEVASLMRCPVCQGLSVADSPASSAVDLKAEVRRQLALGYSRDQVLASFERSYGEFIRLEPKAQGFNWLVWLAPMIALVVGVLVIFFRLRPLPQVPAALSSTVPGQAVGPDAGGTTLTSSTQEDSRPS